MEENAKSIFVENLKNTVNILRNKKHITNNAIQKLLQNIKLVFGFSKNSLGKKLFIKQLIFNIIICKSLPGFWLIFNSLDLRIFIILKLIGKDFSINLEYKFTKKLKSCQRFTII